MMKITISNMEAYELPPEAREMGEPHSPARSRKVAPGVENARKESRKMSKWIGALGVPCAFTTYDLADSTEIPFETASRYLINRYFSRDLKSDNRVPHGYFRGVLGDLSFDELRAQTLEKLEEGE